MKPIDKTMDEGRWLVKRRDYHADTTCDCHSSLEIFRKSVALYHAICVTGELAYPGASEAQEFGTAVHTFILEREKFDAEFLVLSQKFDMRRNADKEAFAVAKVQANGRFLLGLDQYDQIRRMADAVMNNPAARDLLEAPGEVEQAIRWYDPVTGLPLRSMLDKMVLAGPTVDLKTAIDPNPDGWAKAAANFGYHRQAALYQAGRAAALREPVQPFQFIVIGKELPHDCCVYELDEQAMALGLHQNIRDLEELRDCKDFQRWHNRFGQDIIYLALPRWAYYA